MTIYIDGTTAFQAQEAGVVSGTGSPSPAGVGGSPSYWHSASAAGATAYQRWNLDGSAAWQFRRLIYLDQALGGDLDLLSMRGGSDATNNLIIRIQGTNKLRIVATGGVFSYTATTDMPLSGWKRMEGYGNAATGNARIALFDLAATTPIAGIDSTLISVAQGGAGPTGVRLGKCSGASSFTGKLAWDLDEFRTGADASSAFLGPYTTAALGLSGVVTPSSHTVGQVQTLTLTASGGNANPKTYSTVWDGVSTGPQASNVFTHTDATAGTKDWSATVSQAE